MQQHRSSALAAGSAGRSGKRRRVDTDESSWTTPSAAQSQLADSPAHSPRRTFLLGPDFKTLDEEVTATIAAVERRLARIQQAMSESTSQLPTGVVVEFAVGGEVVSVDSDTLRRFPGSVLFRLAVLQQQALHAGAAERTTNPDSPAVRPRAGALASPYATSMVPVEGHDDEPDGAAVCRSIFRGSKTTSTPRSVSRSDRNGGLLVSHGVHSTVAARKYVVDATDRQLHLDGSGRIVLDRDPAVFRCLINYLRGYKLSSHHVDIDNLSTDFAYFLIDHQNEDHLSEASPCVAPPWSAPASPAKGRSSQCLEDPDRSSAPVVLDPSFQFSGAGSSLDGSRFDTRSHHLAVGIGPWRRSGRIVVSFAIRNEGFVSIGVISRATDLAKTPEFREAPGCMALSTDGACFVHRPPPIGLQRTELGAGWNNGEPVTIEVNFTKRFVRWFRGESIVFLAPLELDELRVAVGVRRSIVEVLAARLYE